MQSPMPGAKPQGRAELLQDCFWRIFHAFALSRCSEAVNVYDVVGDEHDCQYICNYFILLIFFLIRACALASARAMAACLRDGAEP